MPVPGYLTLLPSALDLGLILLQDDGYPFIPLSLLVIYAFEDIRPVTLAPSFS
jgi:hypothetical protein